MVNAEQQGKGVWLKARLELLVPVLGVLILRAMLGGQNRSLIDWQTTVVYGMALLYAALVLWAPMRLPGKEPQPISRRALRETALKVALLVVVAFGLLTLLSYSSSDAADDAALGPVGALVAMLLLIGLGTTGLAAERRLPIDLFPLLRRRQARRILYVLASAFFLALVVQMWGGIWGELAAGLGRMAGETPPAQTEAAAQFDASHPLILLLNFLIGAGLFEELLFRVGIMTPIWAWTGRWGWGLLVSALAFGLYHISPLSGMAAHNLQAPVTAVAQSFGAGLAMGLIYRYRGFTTAVMVHALGNWLVVMILLGT